MQQVWRDVVPIREAGTWCDSDPVTSRGKSVTQVKGRLVVPGFL